MRGLFSILLILTASSLVAQNTPGFGLVGYGYGLPPNTIAAAPGEIVMVSVLGIAGKDVSASIRQSSNPTTAAVTIVGVQQTGPITNITMLLPFELAPTATSLEIRQGGSVAGQIPLRQVPDSIHVINSCDQTGIFLSPATEVPPGICGPMVLHAHGPLVTVNHPAQPGETLVMFAYGLGATNPPPGQGRCCLLDLVETLNLNFDFRPNAAASKSFPGFGVTAPPEFAAYISSGLYQVNFVVPPLPSPAPPPCGDGVISNLTVTVTGAASIDGAQLCVQ